APGTRPGRAVPRGRAGGGSDGRDAVVARVSGEPLLVVLLPQLADEAQLGLQVVDVLLLVGEDVLEDPGGGDVPARAHQLDPWAQPGDGLQLDGEVRLELLDDGLPDPQGADLLVVRQARSEEHTSELQSREKRV